MATLADMTATQCPRCGQGSVQRYRFKPTGEHVRVCDECEALWPDEVALDTDGFQALGDFASKRGGSGLWDELAPATP